MEKTKYFSYSEINNKVLQEAATFLLAGKLIAFPTETVYGIGVDYTNEEAIDRLNFLKGRPKNKAMTLHISSMKCIPSVTSHLSKDFHILAEAFWPGPLTLIVLKNPSLTSSISTNDTIGIRMPHHKTAQTFIDYAGGAIAATSANLSGEPSLTTGKEIFQRFQHSIDIILDEGASPIGMASTVLLLVGDSPKVLRQGSVSKASLEQVLRKKILEE
jgi:L-threonylcarbamoyladenylate synthase